MLCKISNNKAPPFYFVLMDFYPCLTIKCWVIGCGSFAMEEDQTQPKKIFFPRWFKKSQGSVKQVNWLSVFVLMRVTPCVYIRRNRSLLAGWFCRKNWKITCVVENWESISAGEHNETIHTHNAHEVFFLALSLSEYLFFF